MLFCHYLKSDIWFVDYLFIEVLYSVLFEMRKKSVYVVFKGRRTGVFNSWPECHDQIDGLIADIVFSHCMNEKKKDEQIEMNCEKKKDFGQVIYKLIVKHANVHHELKPIIVNW